MLAVPFLSFFFSCNCVTSILIFMSPTNFHRGSSVIERERERLLCMYSVSRGWIRTKAGAQRACIGPHKNVLPREEKKVPKRGRRGGRRPISFCTLNRPPSPDKFVVGIGNMSILATQPNRISPCPQLILSYRPNHAAPNPLPYSRSTS